MKKVNTYMLFRNFKRVTIIIMVKLQYLKLIKNKMVFQILFWILKINPNQDLYAYKSGIFLLKSTQGKGLKIISPKQMNQRLSIAFVQVKARNTCKIIK